MVYDQDTLNRAHRNLLRDMAAVRERDRRLEQQEEGETGMDRLMEVGGILWGLL